MRNTEPRHINLNMLISRLKEGHFVIPDFQREFKWQPQDIRDLMRSIFLDYYIGSFLLWKGKEDNFKSLSCETIYGFKGKIEQIPWGQSPGNPEHIVLDGQQRLTALYYAFVAPDVKLPKRKNRAVYFVHVDKFMDERYDESFQYDWRQSRSDKIMNDREFQYKEHIFPLSMIGADGWDLSYWVRDYKEYWEEIAMKAKTRQDMSEYESAKRYAEKANEFGLRIKEITEEYQIAYIELGRDLAIDKVCDIFTQLNSRGVQLDIFDFISALLKPKGLQLKHMWRKAESNFSEIDKKIDKMKIYVLQVMSILLQNYCSPKYLYSLLPEQETAHDPEGRPKKEILIPNTDSFEEHWDNAVRAITSAIKMLESPREFGGISSKYFPYVSILPVFAALQFKRQRLPSDLQLEAQHKIKRWYWASVFTNRYSGSTESNSASDFIHVMAWMKSNNREEDEPKLIQEFKDQFHSLDLHNETKGTSIYNGIFNLLVLQGAKDWIKGDFPEQHEDLDDHHIIPVSWSKTHLNNSSLTIDTILNRTPLTAETNRNIISDHLPNKYLKKLIENNGKTKVRAILESHFISSEALSILLRDPFTPNDYEEFINARQDTILKAIERKLCI